MNAVRGGFSGALEQEIAISPRAQAIRENCVRRFSHGRLHIIFPFFVGNALAFPPKKNSGLGRHTCWLNSSKYEPGHKNESVSVLL